MKLGIFTTVTKAEERGDNWADAYSCYESLADVLTVIDGQKTWPHEFKWETIGEHFQKGYEMCNADWVIHADIDFIFHEKTFDAIRSACEQAKEAPAIAFNKLQFILPDRFNLKSRLVLAVNKKKYGKRIKFDSGGDGCQPSLDGQELRESFVPNAAIGFFNYEKLTKTKAQIAEDVGRMDRAWFRSKGKYMYGKGDNESALDGWLHMMYGRFQKEQEHIKLEDHPIFVQDTIANLTSDQFGYSGFDYLKRNDYTK